LKKGIINSSFLLFKRAILFGLFGGAWSLDGFDYDGIILVNVRWGRGFRGLDGFVYDGSFFIKVGWGRGIGVVHDFEDSDLGIFVLILTRLSIQSAVHDND
jgi:hypothetical protein